MSNPLEKQNQIKKATNNLWKLVKLKEYDSNYDSLLHFNRYINQGAMINQRSKSKQSILHIAIQHNCKKICRVIRTKYPKELETKDKYGQNIWHYFGIYNLFFFVTFHNRLFFK